MRPRRGSTRPGGQDACPPLIVTGSTGTWSDAARRNAPDLKRSTPPVRVRSPSGKIMATWPAWSSRTASRADDGSGESMRAGKAQAPDEPVEQGDLEEPVPRHVIDPAPDRDAHERWIGVGLMVRRDDDGPGGGN